MSFEAPAHLAEGLCLNTRLMLVENSLIFLVGTQIPIMSMVGWKFILLLKTLSRNMALRCHNLK